MREPCVSCDCELLKRRIVRDPSCGQRVELDLEKRLFAGMRFNQRGLIVRTSHPLAVGDVVRVNGSLEKVHEVTRDGKFTEALVS